MTLTDRQKRTIARIIERHVGWMVGWSVSEVAKREAYYYASRDIAIYIKRISTQKTGTTP